MLVCNSFVCFIIIIIILRVCVYLLLDVLDLFLCFWAWFVCQNLNLPVFCLFVVFCFCFIFFIIFFYKIHRSCLGCTFLGLRELPVDISVNRIHYLDLVTPYDPTFLWTGRFTNTPCLFFFQRVPKSLNARMGGSSSTDPATSSQKR